MIRKQIRKFLTWFAGKLPKGRERKDYPQLWYYMPHNRVCRKILQFYCGLLTNHEFSKTEKGYGGGRYADQWCRWCDKMFKIPLEEMEWSSEMADVIRYSFGKEDLAAGE